MKQKALVIYNPHAGTKRRLLPNQAVSLEEIKQLLAQYQIPADFQPTKYPKHATELAKQAAEKGYKTVLVAGGDGTVGEVANGLIGTKTTLGIIPLGSIMNVAKMLSIPTEVEKAVEILKIGRTRRIDVGCVTHLNNRDLETPFFFLESAGLGLEAQLHSYLHELEEGQKGALVRIFKTLFEYYGRKATLILDQKEIQTRAILIIVSNGPYTGANLAIAPKAKLNDNLLTVSLFKMTKWELFNYFLRLIRAKQLFSPKKVTTYQAKEVEIKSRVERTVHADARIFGTTPVKFSIRPDALNVIIGFPKLDEPSALLKKTYLN